MGLPIAKDCPFCGSRDVDECVKETENYKKGTRVYILFMRCYVCDASSKAFSFCETDDGESYFAAWGNAIDAWNRRASDGSN